MGGNRVWGDIQEMILKRLPHSIHPIFFIYRELSYTDLEVVLKAQINNKFLDEICTH
jgi:hypothetical protein